MLPTHVIFGFAGALGGAVRGLIAFAKKNFKGKKFDVKKIKWGSFDWSIFGDTVWQGALLGAGISVMINVVTWLSFVYAALSGMAIDSLTNKLNIKVLPWLKKIVLKS